MTVPTRAPGNLAPMSLATTTAGPMDSIAITAVARARTKIQSSGSGQLLQNKKWLPSQQKMRQLIVQM